MEGITRERRGKTDFRETSLAANLRNTNMMPNDVGAIIKCCRRSIQGLLRQDVIYCISIKFRRGSSRRAQLAGSQRERARSAANTFVQALSAKYVVDTAEGISFRDFRFRLHLGVFPLDVKPASTLGLNYGKLSYR